VTRGSAREPDPPVVGSGPREEALLAVSDAIDLRGADLPARPERRASEATLRAEEALVRAAAAGDSDSFVQIYDRFASPLYGYAARRLADPARAEDLVQDVFMALIRNGARYVARAPLGAYLFRVARYRVINAWRDAPREVSVDVERAATPRYDDTVDVRAALAELPARCREPIELSIYEGLTYQEIAETVGCPIGTVRSRIARGKRALADRLGRDRR